jgi:hypothetical protein
VTDGPKNVPAYARAVRGGGLNGTPSPTPIIPTESATPTHTNTRTPTASATGTTTRTTVTQPPCIGDCSGIGVVTISDLITGVNMSLGVVGPDHCPAFDRNQDERVTIEELIAAVRNALAGCGGS